MDEVERSEAALRGMVRGLSEPRLFASDWLAGLDEIPAEGIQVRLHTDPPNDAPEATWTWASAEVSGDEVTHWSLWDTPGDRPRRVVGRPLRWLGGLLVRLGTRQAKLIASGRADG